MAKLVFHNFKCVYRLYFMVDVIEIFRTYKRKVDYSFYYNKSLLNDAKIVILNALQTVCAVLAPMDTVCCPIIGQYHYSDEIFLSPNLFMKNSKKIKSNAFR